MRKLLFLPLILIAMTGPGCTEKEDGEDDDDATEVTTEVKEDASEAIDSLAGDTFGEELTDKEAEDALMGKDKK